MTKILNCFIAGSKKLVSERDVLRSAVNRVNNKIRSKGIILYSKTYEDFKSNYVVGGQQNLYNKEIRQSDFFVVVLNGQIGTITLDEYKIARNTFLENKKHPVIFVFVMCNKVESVEIINIKKSLETDRQYWREYTSIHELGEVFEKLLTDWFLTHDKELSSFFDFNIGETVGQMSYAISVSGERLKKSLWRKMKGIFHLDGSNTGYACTTSSLYKKKGWWSKVDDYLDKHDWTVYPIALLFTIVPLSAIFFFGFWWEDGINPISLSMMSSKDKFGLALNSYQKNTSKDSTRAHRFMREAAFEGFYPAIEYLEDEDKGGNMSSVYTSPLRKAVELGDDRATPSLVDHLLVFENDTLEALKYCKQSALEGNAHAMERLGTIYYCRHQDSLAIQWWGKAMDNGDAHAPAFLAELCKYNEWDKKERYLHIAAEKGNVYAMINLGVDYIHRAKYDTAYHYITMAVEATKWKETAPLVNLAYIYDIKGFSKYSKIKADSIRNICMSIDTSYAKHPEFHNSTRSIGVIWNDNETRHVSHGKIVPDVKE